MVTGEWVPPRSFAIRKRRLDLGFRQKNVARILGCDETTITNWENGRRSPTISHTAKIAEFSLAHHGWIGPRKFPNKTISSVNLQIDQAVHEHPPPPGLRVHPMGRILAASWMRSALRRPTPSSSSRPTAAPGRTPTVRQRGALRSD